MATPTQLQGSGVPPFTGTCLAGGVGVLPTAPVHTSTPAPPHWREVPCRWGAERAGRVVWAVAGVDELRQALGESGKDGGAAAAAAQTPDLRGECCGGGRLGGAHPAAWQPRMLAPSWATAAWGRGQQRCGVPTDNRAAVWGGSARRQLPRKEQSAGGLGPPGALVPPRRAPWHGPEVAWRRLPRCGHRARISKGILCRNPGEGIPLFKTPRQG